MSMRIHRASVLFVAFGFGASACATTGPENWNQDPKRCALIGAAIGAGGAVAANPRHSDDTTQDYAVGAAVGMAAGAAIGWVLCSLSEPSPEPVAQTPPPPPPPRRAEPPPPSPAPVVRKRIVLRGVQFDFDSARIQPVGMVILDEARRVLKESRDTRVEIAGHSDGIGSEQYNQGLSERRAKSVRFYLISNGIDQSRLTWTGYGESRPVADNSTDEGRAQNRRVELNVLR